VASHGRSALHPERARASRRRGLQGCGTIAKYHAAGVRTVLVTCTGGEEGDILNPVMDTPEVRADITGSVAASWTGPPRSSATTRSSCSATATRACRARRRTPIRVHSPPARSRRPSSASWPRSAAYARRWSITYGDDQERYPHPDHIRVHEISVAAFDASGDAGCLPRAHKEYQPSKMYYSVWSPGTGGGHAREVSRAGLESPFDESWLERPGDE